MPSKPKPARYAEGTHVPASQSQEEIKRLLDRHGATAVLVAEALEDGVLKVMLQFRIHGRMVKFVRRRPSEDEAKISPFTSTGQRTQARRNWCDAEWRRQWRALLLIIKAKLELVASGDTTFDREFLADIMLPDGTTVATQALPAIEAAYQTGQMPKLLLSGG